MTDEIVQSLMTLRVADRDRKTLQAAIKYIIELEHRLAVAHPIFAILDILFLVFALLVFSFGVVGKHFLGTHQPLIRCRVTHGSAVDRSCRVFGPEHEVEILTHEFTFERLDLCRMEFPISKN